MRPKRMGKDVLVKKYGNRRLYDTRDSRYVTLAEIAAKVRAGAEVRVVDAKTSEDLTQPTLAQILLDECGGAALLPVTVLTELLRLEDAALADFLGRQLGQELSRYRQTRPATSPSSAEMDGLKRQIEELRLTVSALATNKASP